jgi:hypothetical protein
VRLEILVTTFIGVQVGQGRAKTANPRAQGGSLVRSPVLLRKVMMKIRVSNGLHDDADVLSIGV